MVLTLTFPGLPGGALPDQDRYTIELSTNIEDSDGQNLAGDRDFDIRALEGDVNGGRSSASGGLDSGGVLSHLGEAVGMDNAQYDVNTSGDIDPLDVGAVSGRFGHSAS